eukprot:TRINITY_DN789_c0_g1_i2.p1 TRINITY_DN789_c0_g1~~TRINITY_DN789_c0_g1_i2.p1  ORF type:complete len:472 (-),score=113.76 TRINITY_DN789_c0_g1_i2:2-1378(-)
MGYKMGCSFSEHGKTPSTAAPVLKKEGCCKCKEECCKCKECEAPKEGIEFYYFDMPLRGEGIRLLLRHACVSFVDHRVKMADWPALKGKWELQQMPVIIWNGKPFAQSCAILGFLGKKYGYLPSSPEENYEITCSMNIFEEIVTKCFMAFSEMSPLPEAVRKGLQGDVVDKDIPLLMGMVEEKLKAKENKEFLVGNQLTVADFYIMGIYQSLSMMPIKHVFEKSYPLFISWFNKRMAQVPPPAPPKPKLYYFDMPARGEMLRLLLRHAKVNFEDVRIKMPEWPAMKNNFPMKQLPVIEAQGKQFFQTDAMMHSLSLKYGYLPLEPMKYSKVIEACGIVKDFFEEFAKFVYKDFPEEKKKAWSEEFYSKKAALIIGALEKRLKENKTQDFMFGRRYTMVEFYVVCTAKWILKNPQFADKFAPILKHFPVFSAYMEKRLVDFPQLYIHRYSFQCLSLIHI